MLNILDSILHELPTLMTTVSGWQSLNIDYETPHTERIWKQHGDVRINLHRILPSTQRPFFHPHPWPCSMLILKGKYEMGLGYSNNLEISPSKLKECTTPQVISTCVLNEGSKYEMVSKRSWHYIKPLDKPVYSVMVSGLPWDNTATSYNNTLLPLSEDVFRELFKTFTYLIWKYNRIYT